MKKILFFAAALFFVASCTDVDLEQSMPDVNLGEPREVSVTVSANSTVDSRVVVEDDWSVCWEEGESVMGWSYGDYSSSEFTMTSLGEDFAGESATFTGTITGDYFRLISPYNSSDVITDYTYTVDLSSQKAGLQSTYMVSEELIDATDKSVFVAMVHVGASAQLNIAYEGEGDYTLESVEINDVPSSIGIDLTKTISDDGFYSASVTSSIVVDCSEQESQTVVKFNILPFTVSSGNSVSVTLRYKDENDLIYSTTVTTAAADGDKEFVRATYNTLSVTCDLSDLVLEASADLTFDAIATWTSADNLPEQTTWIIVDDAFEEADVTALKAALALTEDEITLYFAGSSFTSIPASAFADCTNVVSITAPTTVTEVGDYAFSGCTGLTSLKLAGESVTFGTDVFGVDADALTVASAIDLTIGEEVAYDTYSIAWNGFIFNSINGQTESIPLSWTSFNDASGYFYCTYTDGNTTGNVPLLDTWYFEDETLKAFASASKSTVPTTTIQFALYRASVLDSSRQITLDFGGCPNLTTVNTDALTYLPSVFYALKGIDGISFTSSRSAQENPGLTKVTLSSTLEDITLGYQCFTNCSSLATLENTENVTFISSSALKNTALTTINFPNLSVVGGNAFSSMSNLTDVYLTTSTIEYILAGASANETTGVVLYDSTVSGHFYNNAFTTSATSTLYLSDINYKNATDADGGTEGTINTWLGFTWKLIVNVDDPTTDPDYGKLQLSTFADDYASTVPDGTEWTFYGEELTSATAEAIVTALGATAETDITLDFSACTFTEIPASAFATATNIAAISLPTVTTVGEGAFNSDEIANIALTVTAENYGEIDVYENTAAGFYWSGYYWQTVNGITEAQPLTMDSFSSTGYYYCYTVDGTGNTTDTAYEYAGNIPSSTTWNIEGETLYAGVNQANLYTKLPTYIQAALHRAYLLNPETQYTVDFSGCSATALPNDLLQCSTIYPCNLVAVTGLDKITSIGQRTFKNNPNLTSVTLGADVEVDAAFHAFYGCTSLAEIVNQENIIGFSGSLALCGTALTSIDLPKLKYIAGYIFQGMPNLTTIKMTNSEVTYFISDAYSSEDGSMQTGVFGDSTVDAEGNATPIFIPANCTLYLAANNYATATDADGSTVGTINKWGEVTWGTIINADDEPTSPVEWTLENISAESFPEGDEWTITNTTEPVKADFAGLVAALNAVTEYDDITVNFPNLVGFPAGNNADLGGALAGVTEVGLYLNFPSLVSVTNYDNFHDVTALKSISMPKQAHLSARMFKGCANLTSLTFATESEDNISLFLGTAGTANVFTSNAVTDLALTISEDKLGDYEIDGRFLVYDTANDYTVEFKSINDDESDRKVDEDEDDDDTYVTGLTFASFGDDATYNASNLPAGNVWQFSEDVTTFEYGAADNLKACLAGVSTAGSITLDFSACSFESLPMSALSNATYELNSNSVYVGVAGTTISALGKVILPTTVTEIGIVALYGSTSLTSIEGLDNVSTFDAYSFTSCTALTSITLPASGCTIGASAFHSCSLLATVENLNKVTYLNASCFSGCISLTVIDISGVTSIVSGTDTSIFSGCTSLTTVTLNSNLTTLGKWMFDGCTALKYISGTDSLNNFGIHPLRKTIIEDLYLPTSTMIGTLANNGLGVNYFDTMGSTGADTYEEKVLTAYGSSENATCNLYLSATNYANVSITANEGGWTDYKWSGAYWKSVTNLDYVEPLSLDTFETAYASTVPEGITWTFESGSTLSETTAKAIVTAVNASTEGGITLDLSACTFTEIPEGAFAGATNLVGISLPTVTTVGDGAFDSESTSSIVLTVTDETYATINIYELTDGKLVWEDYTWASINGVSEAATPDFTAFTTGYYATNLPTSDTWNIVGSAMVDSSTTEDKNGVRDALARAAEAGRQITIDFTGSTFTMINDYSFYGATALKEVKGLENVKTIDPYAFTNCTSLEKITLSSTNSITIYGVAFSGCTSLTTVENHGNITTLGAQVFKTCTSLTGLVMPYLKAVPNNVFDASSITNLDLGSLYTGTDVNYITYSASSFTNFDTTACDLIINAATYDRASETTDDVTTDYAVDASTCSWAGKVWKSITKYVDGGENDVTIYPPVEDAGGADADAVVSDTDSVVDL